MLLVPGKQTGLTAALQNPPISLPPSSLCLWSAARHQLQSCGAIIKNDMNLFLVAEYNAAVMYM